jgi:small subunit ribosomal protein S9
VAKTEKTATKKASAKSRDVVMFWGTGRRKTAIARVRLMPEAGGKGTIQINGRELEDYSGGRQALKSLVFQPFITTGTQNHFRMIATVKGGGIASQIDAVRHGLARALLASDPNLRSPLARAELLRRDPRAKERKKYGRKRARKGFQYSKR